MIVQFTARHFEASETLKESSVGRMKDLTKFYQNIISAHVILSAGRKNQRNAEVIVGTKKRPITARGRGDNIGTAVDKAFGRVERQLKKLNEKIKSHKNTALKESLKGETLD